MNASVRWKTGLSFLGQADTGYEVPLGASLAVGGANDGFRPLELMAISLAGCTAMDVISILTKKNQSISGFSVNVQSIQADDHPRVFTQMTVHYYILGHSVEETAVRRAIELSATRYCPALAMLSKVFHLKLEFEIQNDNGRTIKGDVS